MTSLSRRKRQTTVRRTTRGRTIFSLAGMALLAAGRGLAADAPTGNAPALYPLYGTAGQADLRQQQSLTPVLKSAAPANGPTYYYQKDAAAKTAILPAVYQ